MTFSRTLFGSQVALQVVILATLSLVIGVPLGLVSGYLGGRLDRVLLFFDGHYLHPARTTPFRDTGICGGRGILNAAIAISIAYIPVLPRCPQPQSVKPNY